MTDNIPKNIPSFGRRRMRKLPSKKYNLMQNILPKLAFSSDFLQKYPETCLEIGFGGGENLITQARNNPNIGFIGCEVFMNIIAKMLDDNKINFPENIRIYTDDARILMEKLPNSSINKVFILFPDPWPKLRHNKRRIINKNTLNILHRIMLNNGKLHIATDHKDYESWILEKILADKNFIWQAKSANDFINEPTDWIRTRYQHKAKIQGRDSNFYLFKNNK